MILYLTQVTKTYIRFTPYIRIYMQASESTEDKDAESEEVLQLDGKPSKATPEEEINDEHQEL